MYCYYHLAYAPILKAISDSKFNTDWTPKNKSDRLRHRIESSAKEDAIIFLFGKRLDDYINEFQLVISPEWLRKMWLEDKI
jgi:hypothetical protein